MEKENYRIGWNGFIAQSFRNSISGKKHGFGVKISLRQSSPRLPEITPDDAVAKFLKRRSGKFPNSAEMQRLFPVADP
jgi:hypothetical protein